MSGGGALVVYASISTHEAAAAERAAERLASLLTQAANAPWTCTIDLNPARLPQAALSGQILITSMLGELEAIQEPWVVMKARLQAWHRTLADSGATVFITTIFRVCADAETGWPSDQLKRVRQLNLLAAELSHEYGAYVIDIDRAFSDIGSWRLQTDHRLLGDSATDQAAYAIAAAVVANGLDAFAPFSLLERVHAMLERERPIPPGAGDYAPNLVSSAVMSVGKGRRRQSATTVVDNIQEGQAGRLIGLLFKGQMGPGAALMKLMSVVRKRGLSGTMNLIVSGFSHALSRRS